MSVMRSEKTAVRPAPAVAAYAWVILAAVYRASVTAPFNQGKAPPIMPLLMQAYGLDLVRAGWLVSSVSLMGLLLALPSGVILQRFGARVTGLAALGCLALGSAWGALSTGFGALLMSRVLEGVGVGLIGVVAPATIALWFPPERQGTPMGIWATWVPMGNLAMYMLAPALAAGAGWRAVWWAGAGFTAGAMVLFGLLIRQPPAAGAAALPPKAEAPDLWKALAHHDIWLLALSFTCFNTALIGIATYYPTFLNTVRGYALPQAALVASITTMVVLFAAPLAGWLSDRIGSRRLIIALPFLPVAVTLLFPFVATGWLLVAVLFIQGLVVGASPTAAFAATPEVMRKPQWTGLGLSVLLLGQYVGQLVGPMLFGLLIARLGWAGAGYAMIPLCLAGFASGWLVRVR